MRAIRIAHGGADYEVLIGSLSAAAERLQHQARGAVLPIISDERVFGLHGKAVNDIVPVRPILVPRGEAAKDWQTLAAIVDRLAAMDIRRGTPIIAFGGGSIGDVAGLAASLYMRGCPVIHVPTTLLAQADSAIGGKTAIDSAGRKNLAGTFHHPSLVIADPSLLDTLDQRQMRSGYAEVVKYGLIDDPVFFAWCESNGAAVIGGESRARQEAIEHCIESKARFVIADPQDSCGRRALLNLGHTFGHAIEAIGASRVLHGEAVAAGMCLAFAYSRQLGLCSHKDVARVAMHLKTIGLPTSLRDVEMSGRQDELMQRMAGDKKARPDGLTLILARGIGRAFVESRADRDSLATFLREQP